MLSQGMLDASRKVQWQMAPSVKVFVREKVKKQSAAKI